MSEARYPCDTQLLAKIRQEVMIAARKSGLNDDEIADLVLAVDEACTNVMQHAYSSPAPADATLGLLFEATADGFAATLTDFGRPFDPNSIPPPDLTALRGRGLGIYLIRRLVDNMEYWPGSPNRLRLFKRRRLP